MKFIDAAPIAGTRRTADGYLVAEVRTARTGIQDYAGHEVGKPEMAVVRVYRPEDQVFAKDSLGSYAHRPVTNDHPDESVTADNWRDVAVGQIGDEVARDGDFVRVPLIVMDAVAIKAVEDGKRELSAGYTCDLSFEDGVTPDGQPYDAIQKSIRINHVAIVKNGRAGSQARIGDGAISWGARPVTSQTADERKAPMAENLRKVLVDGLQVETTDAGAAAIEKLTKDLASSAAKLADAVSAHNTAIATKDEEIGKLKADLKTAQDAAKIDIDKLVADRAELVEAVKAIDARIDVTGRTDAELRKAAVASRLGDEMVKDASDAEIVGMFKAIAKDTASADPVRGAISNLKPVAGNDRAMADKAWQDSIADLNGWRNQKGA